MPHPKNRISRPKPRFFEGWPEAFLKQRFFEYSRIERKGNQDKRLFNVYSTAAESALARIKLSLRFNKQHFLANRQHYKNFLDELRKISILVARQSQITEKVIKGSPLTNKEVKEFTDLDDFLANHAEKVNNHLLTAFGDRNVFLKFKELFEKEGYELSKLVFASLKEK